MIYAEGASLALKCEKCSPQSWRILYGEFRRRVFISALLFSKFYVQAITSRDLE
jgi:hypothetical protein